MSRKTANLVILNFNNKFKCSIETRDYKDEDWSEYVKIYFENGYLQLFTPPQMKKNSSAYFVIYNRLKKLKNLINLKASGLF